MYTKQIVEESRAFYLQNMRQYWQRSPEVIEQVIARGRILSDTIMRTEGVEYSQIRTRFAFVFTSFEVGTEACNDLVASIFTPLVRVWIGVDAGIGTGGMRISEVSIREQEVFDQAFDIAIFNLMVTLLEAEGAFV